MPAHLVSQATRAAVDQHDDLVFSQAERLGNLRLEDFLYVLDFEKMVAAAERAQLRAPALLGAVGDLRRVGAVHLPGLLAEFDVGRFAVAVLNDPGSAALEHLVQIFEAALDEALRARA